MAPAFLIAMLRLWAGCVCRLLQTVVLWVGAAPVCPQVRSSASGCASRHISRARSHPPL